MSPCGSSRSSPNSSVNTFSSCNRDCQKEPSAQETPQTPRVWAAKELKWEHDKTLTTVQSVLLWGDPSERRACDAAQVSGWICPAAPQASVGRAGSRRARCNRSAVRRVGGEETWSWLLLGDSGQHGTRRQVCGRSRVCVRSGITWSVCDHASRK